MSGDDVIVSRVALDELINQFQTLATGQRTPELMQNVLNALRPREVDAPPAEADVNRVHRTLALGYLAGLLHGDPRVRFSELDPERTVIYFPELPVHPFYVVTLTAEDDR